MPASENPSLIAHLRTICVAYFVPRCGARAAGRSGGSMAADVGGGAAT